MDVEAHGSHRENSVGVCFASFCKQINQGNRVMLTVEKACKSWKAESGGPF